MDTITGHTKTARPASPKVKRAWLAAVMAGAVAFHTTTAAGGWVFLEQDRVSKGSPSGINIVGSFYWYYASDNSNHRYLQSRLVAYQTSGAPMCVGVKIIMATQTRSSTRGGSVGGGWSLTGPSANASASYSRTTMSGMTSDGFSWKCPTSNRAYVQNVVVGDRAIHPTLEGIVTHVGTEACLSSDPADVNNRRCTAWDVNKFGGQ